MKSKCNFLIICFFISISLYGQQEFSKGYIITQSYDTLSGFIVNNSYRKNAQLCEFTENVGTPTQLLKPSDINAFKFSEGKYYISKQVAYNNEKLDVFLEFLIKGKLNIYYLRLNEKELYFAQKENDTLVYLDNSDIYFAYDQVKSEWYVSEEKTIQKIKQSDKYKGILNFMLQEAPGVQKDVNSIRLSHNSLINMARDYHYSICDNEDCIVFEKSRKPKVVFGLSTGYSFIDYVNVDERTQNAFGINTFTYPGLLFSLQLLGISEQVNLRSALYCYNVNTMTENTERGIELSGLATNLPISVAYEFASQKLIPYASMGVVLHYLVNAKAITYSYLFGEVIKKGVNEKYTTNYQSLKIGGNLSAGLKYAIHTNYIIDLGLSYHIYSFNTPSNSVGVRLGVGYLFD